MSTRGMTREQRIERALARETWLCRNNLHDMLHPTDAAGNPADPAFDHNGYPFCRPCKYAGARNYYALNASQLRRKKRAQLREARGIREEDYRVNDDLDALNGLRVDDDDSGLLFGAEGVRKLWLTAATTWMPDGACNFTDPELFYGFDGENAAEAKYRIKQAKQVCANCPVIEQCKEYALAAGEKEGVWGGLSARDRERVRGDEAMQLIA